MKPELSSIDLFFLIKEIKKAENGILGKTFNNQTKQLFIEVYEKNTGKKFLTYYHPFFWLGNKKVPGDLSNFSMYLRKHYERAKIISINQVKSERIIELVLDKGGKSARIFFELFGQGNAILCDDTNTIFYPIEVQEWKDRMIKKGEKYNWFENNKNIFEFTEKDFRALEVNENISRTLATVYGFGGVFAEELCLRSEIDPKTVEVNQKQKKKLFGEFSKLLREKSNPQLVFDPQKPGVLKDITPIKLQKYSKLENKPVESFSEALEENLLVLEEAPKENPRIKQLQKRIEIQENTLIEYKKKIDENNKKAEHIYENYEKIEQLLEKGRKAVKAGEEITGITIDRKNKKILAEV
ncbi:NFACT family protein [Candidatus Woesearchaeota archaeon]|nr:NFACT family protein [Candidatus Woesearchaeota archaeon]